MATASGSSPSPAGQTPASRTSLVNPITRGAPVRGGGGAGPRRTGRRPGCSLTCRLRLSAAAHCTVGSLRPSRAQRGSLFLPIWCHGSLEPRAPPEGQPPGASVNPVRT